MTGKVKVDVTRELLTHVIREFNDGITVPNDAEIVGVDYNAEQDLFECVMISDEWPDVQEGAKTFEVGEL